MNKKEQNNYYVIKRQINNELNTRIKEARKEQTELDLNKLIYNLTLTYAISEKAILQRVLLMSSIDKDFKINALNKIEWLK